MLVTATATDTFNYGDWPIAGVPGALLSVPKFPLSVAATRDLLNWTNTFPSEATPTLNGGILASDTTVNLSTGAGAQLPLENFEVSVDDEIIFVFTRSGDILQNCVRGAEDSAPAPHNSGATVQLLITARSHNQLVAEVIELEQFLSAIPLELVIPATTRGDFSLAHGLSRVPRRAVVVMDSDGLIRLQNPVRFDATYIYLNASTDGLTGYVEVWP